MLHIFFPFYNLHAQIGKSIVIFWNHSISATRNYANAEKFIIYKFVVQKTATVTVTASSTSSSFQIG